MIIELFPVGSRRGAVLSEIRSRGLWRAPKLNSIYMFVTRTPMQ